jgi:hypothetical protein
LWHRELLLLLLCKVGDSRARWLSTACTTWRSNCIRCGCGCWYGWLPLVLRLLLSLMLLLGGVTQQPT